MDHIILDTNIFIKENFLHGKKINSLISLSQRGKIKIHITEITYNECKSNFEKSVLKSVGNHNKFRKEQENWVLRNDKSLNTFFNKIDPVKIISDFNTSFDKLISDGVIEIIPYKALNIKTVFDKYFKNELPFGKADKKSEFPDAFSIELIEAFCKTIDERPTVFSTDNDFLQIQTSAFDIREDYEKYLEEKYTELENIKKQITQSLFESNKIKIESQLIDWYKSNLDDESLYYSAINYKDVYDIKVESITVSDMDYSIIEIVDDLVTIEVQSKVTVKVSILTDDEEYMYYDSDDKSYHYLEANYETFEKEFESSIIMSTKIFDEEDYFEDFEIESINENNELSFNVDYDYH